MKKVFALIVSLGLLETCAGDMVVRRAITKEIKSELAAPGSFRFVDMERVQTFTVASEVERAARLVPQEGRGLWVDNPDGGGRMTYEITERKLEGLRAVASTMRQDSIVGGVYRFNYRADIPGQGRDFPVEVYVVASTGGDVFGSGQSAGAAVYSSPTVVRDFRQFTRRSE